MLPTQPCFLHNLVPITQRLGIINGDDIGRGQFAIRSMIQHIRMTIAFKPILKSAAGGVTEM